MARADSAHASVRAGAARGLACTATQPAVLRLAQREIWVRRAVPAVVTLFAGALVAITVVMTHTAARRSSHGFAGLPAIKWVPFGSPTLTKAPPGVLRNLGV